MSKRKSFFSFLFFLLILSIFLTGTVYGIEEKEFWELCKDGSREEINEAIKNGADINKGDQNKVSPLMYAARYNPDPEVIIFLVKNGAYINGKDKNGETALFYALENSNRTILHILLSIGANVNVINDRGQNALFKAINREDEDATRTLL